MLSLFSAINLIYVLEINIFGRAGIIQIWIISSKDINIQCLCKIYCRKLGQYLKQFDALEKSVQITGYELQHLKIVTNGHQYTKTTEDKKFIIKSLNKYSHSNWKQSNQSWNIFIYLKSNVPHIKVHFVFWFPIMIFYLCFSHQFWVKWVCIDIGNSSGHTEQTNSRFPKYLWMFDTEWNAHQIDILDNLLN